MKSESDFKKWFVAQLKKDCDITPIETSTSRGVPDLNLCRQGVEIWVELKLFVGGRVLLRPEQYAWGMRRSMHGGRSFVVAWHKSEYLMIWRFPLTVLPHNKYVYITSAPDVPRGHTIAESIKIILFT